MLHCNQFLWFTSAIQAFPSSDMLEVSEVDCGHDPIWQFCFPRK